MSSTGAAVRNANYPTGIKQELLFGQGTCCAFNPSGDFLAVGTRAGVVVVWNFETRGVTFTKLYHRSPVVAVSWSHNSRLLLSASADGTCCWWNALGDVPIAVARLGCKLKSAQMHPANPFLLLLVSASADRTVKRGFWLLHAHFPSTHPHQHILLGPTDPQHIPTFEWKLPDISDVIQQGGSFEKCACHKSAVQCAQARRRHGECCARPLLRPKSSEGKQKTTSPHTTAAAFDPRGEYVFIGDSRGVACALRLCQSCAQPAMALRRGHVRVRPRLGLATQVSGTQHKDGGQQVTETGLGGQGQNEQQNDGNQSDGPREQAVSQRERTRQKTSKQTTEQKLDENAGWFGEANARLRMQVAEGKWVLPGDVRVTYQRCDKCELLAAPVWERTLVSRAYAVKSLAFSKDFKAETPEKGKTQWRGLLVSVLRDVITLAGGAELEVIGTLQDHVDRRAWLSAELTHDNEYVIGASNVQGKHTLYVWDRFSGALLCVLDGPSQTICQLAAHPSQPIAVSISQFGYAYIWERDYSGNWSAFAPDFEELTENAKYQEREDEFDYPFGHAQIFQASRRKRRRKRQQELLRQQKTQPIGFGAFTDKKRIVRNEKGVVEAKRVPLELSLFKRPAPACQDVLTVLPCDPEPDPETAKEWEMNKLLAVVEKYENT